MKLYLARINQALIVILFLPILVPTFVYVRNFADTPIGVYFRSAIISIFLFLLLLVFSYLILRNRNKTVLFASVAFLLLYQYGALYDALASNDSFFGHHKILGLAYLVLLIALMIVIAKVRISRNFTSAIALISIVFIALQLIQFIPKAIAQYNNDEQTTESIIEDQEQMAGQSVEITVDENSPDVYYIILDMYARNDLLELDFSFDNSYFTDALEKLGFYVAECARSNYMTTRSSLSSSLNMAYLQKSVANASPTEDKDQLLGELIKNSAVFQQFETLGYKTIAFETGYEFTEITNVDVFLETDKPIAFFGNIDPYEILLFKNSIFKVLYDTHIPVVDDIFNRITFPYGDHVKLQNYMFEELKVISTDPLPTFTFVHMTIPHTPFIFRADGSYTLDRRYFSGAYVSPISNELFTDGYINQVQFVNTKLVDAVTEILANSSTPPIIILQGDHSAIMEHRLAILNAYYLPGIDQSELYPAISPVNSFRLIFKQVFGLNYEMLEDASYFAPYESNYEWILQEEFMYGCNN